MKHLKIFEDWDDDFRVGDYVIVIKAYRSKESLYPVNIKNGDRCKVVEYSSISDEYYIIENEDGVREEYRMDRIIPEVKYNSSKFNI